MSGYNKINQNLNFLFIDLVFATVLLSLCSNQTFLQKSWHISYYEKSHEKSILFACMYFALKVNRIHWSEEKTNNNLDIYTHALSWMLIASIRWKMFNQRDWYFRFCWCLSDHNKLMNIFIFIINMFYLFIPSYRICIQVNKISNEIRMCYFGCHFHGLSLVLLVGSKK